MKTRLISFLLLAVLIVTSIPMGALSFVSFAAKTECEGSTASSVSEEEYNTLYVQDGLLYSLDFYKLNKYWSPNGHDYRVPKYHEEGYTSESQSQFLQRDAAFFSNFNNTPGSSLSFHTLKSFDSTEGILSAISETLGEGYVTIRETDKTKRALILEGAEKGEIQTLEMVSKVGSSIGKNLFILNSFRPSAKADAANTFNILAGNSGGSISLVEVNTEGAKRPPIDKVTTITYTMDKGQSLFSMYSGKNEIMNATYKGTLGAENYIGYNGWADNTELYAIRYYSKVLTEAERAQNHFADLAKFFRLDIAGFESYSQANKKAIYEALATYDIGSSTRDEVLATYDAKASELVVATYENHRLNEGEEGYEAHNAFVDACIEKVKSDRNNFIFIDSIYCLPLEERASIYALSGDALTQEAIDMP